MKFSYYMGVQFFEIELSNALYFALIDNIQYAFHVFLWQFLYVHPQILLLVHGNHSVCHSFTLLIALLLGFLFRD